MTPREALSLFDQVASNHHGTRQDHAALQNALMVLNGLVLSEESRGASQPNAQAPEELASDQAESTLDED